MPEVTKVISIHELEAYLTALRVGIDNTRELLEEHDVSLGRTTRKNTFIAIQYEDDITRFTVVITALELHLDLISG